MSQSAAFGRLCVETRPNPPPNAAPNSAAFGRLCVETAPLSYRHQQEPSAAFGRLCVETMFMRAPYLAGSQPPSGGCVLKLSASRAQSFQFKLSRLRAAVC